MPASVLLNVYDPELYRVAFVSAGFEHLHGIPVAVTGSVIAESFGVYYPEKLKLAMARAISSPLPTSFTFSQRGLDRVDRAFEARLVSPLGAGRAVVALQWVKGTFERGVGIAVHPELELALEALVPVMRPEALLETYLYCLLEAAAVELALAVRADDEGFAVLAVVGTDEVAVGDRLSDERLAVVAPLALAVSAEGDEGVVGRAASGQAEPTGWLAPRTLAAARAVRTPSPLAAPSPRGVADGIEPKTLVYLDDDPMSRELLVEFFRLLPLMNLVAVSTVAEARAAIVAHRPSVVIVDAWLGHDSAEPFVTEILTGSDPDPPAVVVLSADANASTMARFRRLGIASYFVKPIDLGELWAELLMLAMSHDPQLERNETRARTNAPSGN